MRFLFWSLLLWIPLFSGAQANFVSSGYTKCTWDEITLMDSSYSSPDSSISFVTTRSFRPLDHREFLGNEIAADSSLRFFTIYFKGNRWRAVPRVSLSAAIGSTSSSGDYVVYTEGDGKTFPDNVDRSTRLSRLYRVNVICFDWPSRVPGYGEIKNVRNTVHNTECLGKQYHSLLLLLKAYKLSQPDKLTHLTLFFHSLGNALFRNSVTKFGTADLGKSLVDNIVLNAACTPTRKHRKWLEQLTFQDHLYVVYNRKDKTLREASLLFHHRLLGINPRKSLAKNTIYMNIHALALNNHNYFLIIPLLNGHPGISSFYNGVFHLKSLNLDDTSWFLRDKNGKAYRMIK